MIRRTCQGCGAKMLTVKTAATGREMPLNADPDPEGNVVIVDDAAVVVPQGQILMDDSVRYMPHFATCPAADQFRRKR